MLIEVSILSLKKANKDKGGGSYLSHDGTIYVRRNEDKLWEWGYHDHDDKGKFIGSRNGDDNTYITKTDCVSAIEKVLYEKAYEEALWRN